MILLPLNDIYLLSILILELHLLKIMILPKSTGRNGKLYILQVINIYFWYVYM